MKKAQLIIFLLLILCSTVSAETDVTLPIYACFVFGKTFGNTVEVFIFDTESKMLEGLKVVEQKELIGCGTIDYLLPLQYKGAKLVIHDNGDLLYRHNWGLP